MHTTPDIWYLRYKDSILTFNSVKGRKYEITLDENRLKLLKQCISNYEYPYLIQSTKMGKNLFSFLPIRYPLLCILHIPPIEII